MTDKVSELNQNELVAYCPMEGCRGEIHLGDLRPEIQSSLMAQPQGVDRELIYNWLSDWSNKTSEPIKKTIEFILAEFDHQCEGGSFDLPTPPSVQEGKDFTPEEVEKDAQWKWELIERLVRSDEDPASYDALVSQVEMILEGRNPS